MFLPEVDPASILLPPELALPRYNIAPTQSVACVGRPTAGSSRELFFARWGLVPSWADDLKIGNRMINARSETVSVKPSFKRAFEKRRCLIPADGYFEWVKTTDGKQPYLIRRQDNAPFAMAGLWEENKKIADDRAPIRSCTVLTTAANALTSAIHDRMPVFLSESSFDIWLDPDFEDSQKLLDMLRPAAEDLLSAVPVSRHVNNVRNSGPKCVAPIDGDSMLWEG